MNRYIPPTLRQWGFSLLLAIIVVSALAGVALAAPSAQGNNRPPIAVLEYK